MFYSSFFCSLSGNAQVKELLKSIHILQVIVKITVMVKIKVIVKIKVAPFYGPQCINCQEIHVGK